MLVVIVIPGERERIASAREGDPGGCYKHNPLPSRCIFDSLLAREDDYGWILLGAHHTPIAFAPNCYNHFVTVARPKGLMPAAARA